MNAQTDTIDTADAGHTLQLVIQLAVLTYVAGWCLGRWLHRANDQLARAWVRVTVPTDLSNLGEVAKPQLQQDLRQMAEVAGGGRASFQGRSIALQGVYPGAEAPQQPASDVDGSTPDPLQCSGFTPASGVHGSTPPAPLQHPLAMAAQGLAATHTAAELRLLVGTRAKLPKHRLAGMAVALAC